MRWYDYKTLATAATTKPYYSFIKRYIWSLKSIGNVLSNKRKINFTQWLNESVYPLNNKQSVIFFLLTKYLNFARTPRNQHNRTGVKNHLKKLKELSF